jgi:hypothetical protein
LFDLYPKNFIDNALKQKKLSFWAIALLPNILFKEERKERTTLAHCTTQKANTADTNRKNPRPTD